MAVMLVLVQAAPLRAMTMSVKGDQLIAIGPVVLTDVAQFNELIGANPLVRTVVFRNSPGGSGRAADAIERVIEAGSFDTVADGFCISACAMMFLSGRNRTFSGREPVGGTSIGFHASYDRNGRLAPEARLQALKQRMIDRTQGKINLNLVDLWLHLADQRSTVRFTYPGEAPSHIPSVYVCQSNTPPNRGVYVACRAVHDIDALQSGIITSADLTHVNL